MKKSKKMQAGGVVKKAAPKAKSVDSKGAFTKVQKRTLAKTKTSIKKCDSCKK